MNSEIVEIKASFFVDLFIKRSFKGIAYIIRNALDLLQDLFVITGICRAMLNMSIYIDMTWYDELLNVLKIKRNDFKAFDKI